MKSSSLSMVNQMHWKSQDRIFCGSVGQKLETLKETGEEEGKGEVVEDNLLLRQWNKNRLKRKYFVDKDAA